MEYTAETVDLPYMGPSLETLLRCHRCGYRHTDFVLTEHKEPTRWSLRIQHAADMSARVVRSGSGTLRIPELGILIEPGIASEAFVSNVEGVLARVERVLGQLLRDSHGPEERARIVELQATLAAMRDGTAEPVTLVLDDPFGNSCIVAEAAIREAIAAEEASQLRTGLVTFDKDGRPTMESS